MRIAQVLPYGVHPYSGLLAAVVGLTRALARTGTGTGAEVELWHLGPWPRPGAERLLCEVTAAGIDRVAIPAPAGTWLLSGEARALVRSRAVDVVHLHGVFSPLNNLLARSLQVPYVLSPHGGYAAAAMARSSRRKRLFRRWLEDPMLRGAAALFVLTEAEADDVEVLAGQARFGGDIVTVPNGIDAGPPRGADGEGFRRELDLEADKLAVFVGRLDVYYKRLDDLVRALAGAPDWSLLLVGPDWQGGQADLEALIGRLGLGRRVAIRPPLRDRELDRALAAADVFALVSRSEGLPLALLEALRRGVPALVSTAVDRAVPVTTCGAGWAVEAAEPAAIAAALGQIGAMDRTDRNRHREAAVSLAAGYDWDEIALRYVAALRETFGQTADPATTQMGGWH